MSKLHFLQKTVVVFCFFILQTINLLAQNQDHVLTPNGSKVAVERRSDGNYNCHGYAWHMHGSNQPNDPVWIEDDMNLYQTDSASNFNTLDIGHYARYWEDESYTLVNYNWWPKGGILEYNNEDHSAVISETQDKMLISKFGIGPLVTHNNDETIYAVASNGSNITCYVQDPDALTADDLWEPPVLGNNPTIEGVSIFAYSNTETYGLDDFPTGATTTWSAEPTGIVTIVPQTNNTVTITPINDSNATVIIKAEIVKDYYEPINVQKTIQIQGTTELSGPNVVCNQNTTFTLINPPLSENVVWNNPPELDVISSDNEGILVKQTTGQQGTAEITATFGSTTETISVWVGVPQQPSYILPRTLRQKYTVNPNETVKFKSMSAFTDDPDYADYWQWACFMGTIVNQGDQLVDITFGSALGQGALMVRTSNTCGYGPYLTYTVEVVDPEPLEMNVFPNPANEYMEVELIEENIDLNNVGKTSAEEDIYIELYDKSFMPVYKAITKEKKFDITTNKLSNGLYHLQIVYKGKKITKQVLIEH